MPAHSPHSRFAACAAALLALVLALGVRDTQVAAQTAPAAKWSAKTTPGEKPAKTAPGEKPGAAATAKGEQSIAVLVNDEPVTGYQIEQRARFLSLTSGGGGRGPELKAKAEARWAQIIQDPKTNARFQQVLQEKSIKTREEALAVQKQFLLGLQKEMLDQLQREMRSSSLPKFKAEAKEELIEERLKLQAAKKLGIEVTDAEVKTMLTDVASRNKMTYEEFSQHLKGSNVDIATMGEKFRAQKAWRDLVSRRYAAQVSVTQRDIDRMLSSAAAETGADTVELQLHKISFAAAKLMDQAALTARYAEAERLRGSFAGCKTMGDLAKGAPGAKFEDMRYVKPSAIAEPMRSMLLTAKDGEMLPPFTTAVGVEVYAVCGRRALSGDEAQRSKALQELQSRELEVLARTHMRNLRQEADIEFR